MNWHGGPVLEVQDGMQPPKNGYTLTGPKAENALYGLSTLIKAIPWEND